MKVYIFTKGDECLVYQNEAYGWINMYEKGPARAINVVCMTDKNKAEKYAKTIGAETMEIVVNG